MHEAEMHVSFYTCKHN